MHTLKKSLQLVVILVIIFATFAYPVGGSAQEGGGSRGTISIGEEGDVSAEAVATAGSLKSVYTWKMKGGYVAAGTGMRNKGYGEIKITGIPKNAKIRAAYLFWNVLAPTWNSSYAQGMINGNSIVGTNVATGDDPCWGAGKSRTYRANVKAYITGNGTYQLTGFASGLTDGSDPWTSDIIFPLMEGASLVIIYQHYGYPYTTIMLYNGSVMTSGGVGSDTVMGPFPAYASYLAYATYIGADGQNNADEPGSFFNGKSLGWHDWDGTDPFHTSTSYSYGNLWDTETPSYWNTAKRGTSVGQYISPGSTKATVRLVGGNDCLVHVAQVLSVSNGNLDTDEDGLQDSWEADGYDHDNNGKVDVNLPKLGANPFHKDIFLEIDWMDDGAGDSHRPDDIVVNRLVGAFKRIGTVASLNPDRRAGIGLHIHRSNSIPHTQDLASDCADIFTNMENIKAANMQPARYVTHHYQLWVHDLCPAYGSTSGIAQDIPGDDSIVSLGSWGPEQGTDDERTGTSMHELGHTLNLRHGFPTGDTFGDGGANDPYTPNHISIMSYIYQTSGLIRNGSYGYWDYQRWNASSLDESCLDETRGVNASSNWNPYGLKWTRWDSTLGNVSMEDLTAGAANGPVDWDGDGNSSETCSSASINSSFNSTDSDLELLGATKAEWQLIVYDGGDVGFAEEHGLNEQGEPIPVFHTNPLNIDELTYEDNLILHPHLEP